MNRYEIIIYWSDEDNVFFAEVPELPGCMAHGNSYEEALANTKEPSKRCLSMGCSILEAQFELKGP